MTKVATVLLLLAGLLVETSLAFCVIPSQRRFNTHVVGSAEDSFMGGNREIEDILSVGGDPFFFTPDGVVEMEEKQEGPSYSFVEGSTFDSQLEEIMAMGGDPSFFAQDGAVEEGKTSFMEGSSFDSQRELIEAMGGDSFFFTPEGVVEMEEAPPATSMPSSFRPVENTVEDFTPQVQPPRHSFVEGALFDTELEEIEAMGGDSFFFAQDGVVEEEAPPAAFVSSSCRPVENTVEAFTPNVQPPRHSFVEGASFDTELEEIEAMGGDSFFSAQNGDVEEEEAPSAAFVSPSSFRPMEDTAEAFTPEVPPPSFVEGSSFGSQRELIEAMGGDSFFFTQDGVVEEEEAPPAAFMSSSFRAMMENTAEDDVTPERFATDGKRPAPSRQEPTDSIAFEWDGTVDDDAHLGFL